MAEPMKIRATLRGDVADVRVLFAHPMETGMRKDPKGVLIPPHFIQTVVIRHNDTTVLNADWSQAVARNPLLGIRIRGAKLGDRISVAWTDNKGEKGGIETRVEGP